MVADRPSRPATEVGLATCAIGTYNFAAIGVFALVPSIRGSLHLGTAAIGILASTQYLVAAIFMFPAARLTERVSPGRIIALSQGAIMVAMFVGASAKSVGVFIVASAMLGVSSALVNPVTNVLSTDRVPVRLRATAMGVKQSGVTVGAALSGLVLPAVASANGWRVALVVPVAPALAVGFWALVIRSAASPARLVLDGPVTGRSRLRLGGFGLGMSGVQLAVMGYVAVYLVDERHFSSVAAGSALSVALGFGGIGRLAWGWLADKRGRRVPILVVLAVASATGLSALPLLSGRGLWLSLAIIGSCSIGWNGVYHTAVAESAGAAGVARATAFAFMFLYAGSIVFPPLLGLCAAKISWDAFWWLAACGAAAAALALSQPLRRSSSPPTDVVTLGP